MVGWCFDLDGRRERDERAKPTIGRAGNLSDGIVAVFSLVRFQEKEMKKALQEKYGGRLIQDGNPGATQWQIGQKR